MGLEFVVDSLDTVDESVKGAYVEKDGKFQLDPDKYAEVKASGLKAKNKELLGKLNEFKTTLKRFEKLQDVEDDELSEFFDWRENKGASGGKGTPTADEIKAAQQKILDKIAKQHGVEKAALEQQLAEIQRENKHYKLTLPVRDAALKAGVLPDEIDDVVLTTGKFFRLNDENKIEVLDHDGDPLGITPQKFFETVYRDLKPRRYAASGAGGSGAQGGGSARTNGQKVMKRADWDKLSSVEQSTHAQAIRKRELVLED